MVRIFETNKEAIRILVFFRNRKFLEGWCACFGWDFHYLIFDFFLIDFQTSFLGIQKVRKCAQAYFFSSSSC